MNVPNHKKKAFRDMTPEERAAIVEAWLAGNVQMYWRNSDKWTDKADNCIYDTTIYRTRPRKLVIPWEHIKPEYKWAAMDFDGEINFYSEKPWTGTNSWATDSKWATAFMLNINTTGIDWRESLTARPEGV